MTLLSTPPRWHQVTGVILAGLAMLAVAFFTLHTDPEPAGPELLTLESLPDISESALKQKDLTYRIIEPICYYRESDAAVFEVEILDPAVAEPCLCFMGDAERFNGFVAELDFIKTHSGRFHPGSTGEGMKEGVTSLAQGLWEIASHPMDTAQGMADGAVALKGYAEKAFAGQTELRIVRKGQIQIHPHEGRAVHEIGPVFIQF